MNGDPIRSRKWIPWAAGLAMSLLFGCIGPPEGVRPVTDFSLERYLGVWYEVARLDHPFERGMTDVSATYSLREDGGVEVLNRGFDPASGKWKEIRGRAYFTGSERQGSLKVSFFGPFYGGYHVIQLDEAAYGHALVCGPSRSYLWILSRDPRSGREKTARLVETARALGFDTDRLIFVPHEQHPL
ncbi:lipocalin family protein [Desulfococcus sp.]|uniref:lipocalin family protein n=1 Tax=Desulfococcus sp. TaxID=2025834 RepID=UPI003593CA28